jgi:hypothetical protein
MKKKIYLDSPGLSWTSGVFTWTFPGLCLDFTWTLPGLSWTRTWSLGVIFWSTYCITAKLVEIGGRLATEREGRPRGIGRKMAGRKMKEGTAEYAEYTEDGTVKG